MNTSAMVGDENALGFSPSFPLGAKLLLSGICSGSGKDGHLDRDILFRRGYSLTGRHGTRWKHLPTHWLGQGMIDAIYFSLSRLMPSPPAMLWYIEKALARLQTTCLDSLWCGAGQVASHLRVSVSIFKMTGVCNTTVLFKLQCVLKDVVWKKK